MVSIIAGSLHHFIVFTLVLFCSSPFVNLICNLFMYIDAAFSLYEDGWGVLLPQLHTGDRKLESLLGH